MRKWGKPAAWLLLSVLSLLSLCKFCAVTAKADNVTYTQMTPDEAYAFYGNSIECTYYNGSGYSTVNLVPSTSRRVYYRASAQSYGEDIPAWMGYDTSLQYVYYYATVSNYSNNPAYLGLDIHPNVHFSNCTDFRFAALAYCGNNNVPNTSSGYSDSFIYVNNLRFSNASNVSQNGYYPGIPLTRSGASGSWYTLAVWADYHSDVIDTANLVRVGFNGARLDGGEIGIYLSLPQYNSGAVPGTGTVTGTVPPSTGDVNVNVTVYVDNSPIQSQLDDYLGGDDTGITTYTVPYTMTDYTIDMNAFESNPVLSSVNIGNITRDLGQGVGFIWNAVDLFVTRFTFLQWMIPTFIVIMTIAWVLWRKT